MAYPIDPKDKYTEAVDEWKSCISQIDKFDGFLEKLREYGFTLITGIITATGFLGTAEESATIQVGVVIVTAFLLWILWRLDQYYQDQAFGAVVRGEFLEKKCKRELINTMSSYAWKNSRTRSSKLVIIYLAFLSALFALGLIFLWNASDQAQTNNGSDSNGSADASFYIKPAQLEPDQEGTGRTVMDDIIVRFVYSPLFWLLIAGFGLVASQVSYTYKKVDNKRSKKYDSLYDRLEKYDRSIEYERESMDLRIEATREYMMGIRKDIDKTVQQMGESERFGASSEARERSEKYIASLEESLRKESARLSSLLQERKTEEEAMEEKYLLNLEYSLKELVATD